MRHSKIKHKNILSVVMDHFTMVHHEVLSSLMEHLPGRSGWSMSINLEDLLGIV